MSTEIIDALFSIIKHMMLWRQFILVILHIYISIQDLEMVFKKHYTMNFLSSDHTQNNV